MRLACTRALTEIARSDPRILLLTADLGFMVLEEFSEAHPTRFFNVGVAEANMIGLATGLAASGYVPYVYSIATFASMRGYEQIRNGPILHKLPVRIIGVGGGFEYGHAGITHHALEDLTIARVQPGLTVVAPADHEQASAAIRATYDLPGPIYYRIGKRDDYVLPGLGGRFRLGRIETVRDGDDVLILVLGSIAAEAIKASDILSRKGIQANVSVVSSLRPAPVEDIHRMLKRFPLVVTVEEHYVDGGLGSLVAEIAAENGTCGRVFRCGVRTPPSATCGGEACLREVNGLSARSISDSVVNALKEFGE
ncbi:MAG: 1-deoxy-D-xylulose-5-phosphate synthase [Desulfomonile tiedjei]|nr:1-deoxy-D-xylulose-5-phosphate synthase [Desulfomonile tiedjei]